MKVLFLTQEEWNIQSIMIQISQMQEKVQMSNIYNVFKLECKLLPKAFFQKMKKKS